MKKYINESLKMYGIAALVIFLWMILEALFDDIVKSSVSDTIIVIILTVSLFYNLEHWNEK